MPVCRSIACPLRIMGKEPHFGHIFYVLSASSTYNVLQRYEIYWLKSFPGAYLTLKPEHRIILCDFSFLLSIKVGKTNKHSLFPQNNWEKVWNLIGEPLSLHRVFHSIRFKVNKVGIQWYPIFCVHTRITLSFVSNVPLPYKYIGVNNRGKSEKSAKNCRIYFEYLQFWEMYFQFHLIYR